MTPLFVAMLVSFSLLASVAADLAATVRLDARLETAAESMALAAAGDGNTADLAVAYQLEEFTVDRDAGAVTVRVWRNGRSATATAVDHRRTLDQAG